MGITRDARPETILVIRRFIRGGANFKGHEFGRPVKPEPSTKLQASANPIDILAHHVPVSSQWTRPLAQLTEVVG